MFGLIIIKKIEVERLETELEKCRKDKREQTMEHLRLKTMIGRQAEELERLQKEIQLLKEELAKRTITINLCKTDDDRGKDG